MSELTFEDLKELQSIFKTHGIPFEKGYKVIFEDEEAAQKLAKEFLEQE